MAAAAALSTLVFSDPADPQVPTPPRIEGSGNMNAKTPNVDHTPEGQHIVPNTSSSPDGGTFCGFYPRSWGLSDAYVGSYTVTDNAGGFHTYTGPMTVDVEWHNAYDGPPGTMAHPVPASPPPPSPVPLPGEEPPPNPVWCAASTVNSPEAKVGMPGGLTRKGASNGKELSCTYQPGTFWHGPGQTAAGGDLHFELKGTCTVTENGIAYTAEFSERRDGATTATLGGCGPHGTPNCAQPYWGANPWSHSSTSHPPIERGVREINWVETYSATQLRCISASCDPPTNPTPAPTTPPTTASPGSTTTTTTAGGTTTTTRQGGTTTTTPGGTTTTSTTMGVTPTVPTDTVPSGTIPTGTIPTGDPGDSGLGGGGGGSSIIELAGGGIGGGGDGGGGDGGGGTGGGAGGGGSSSAGQPAGGTGGGGGLAASAPTASAGSIGGGSVAGGGVGSGVGSAVGSGVASSGFVPGSAAAAAPGSAAAAARVGVHLPAVGILPDPAPAPDYNMVGHSGNDATPPIAVAAAMGLWVAFVCVAGAKTMSAVRRQPAFDVVPLPALSDDDHRRPPTESPRWDWDY